MKNRLDYDGEPFLLLEAKLANAEPATALLYFRDRLRIPAVQLTGAGESYRLFGGPGEAKVLVAPAAAWLSLLP